MLPNTKAYCITMPESANRPKAQAEFDRVGLPVEMWDGVNGQDFGLKTFIPTHTDWFVGPKYIGLYLSHWVIWQFAARESFDNTIIFEDDCEFHPEFQSRFDAYMAQAPSDWDLIYLGACCVRGNPYTKVSENLCVAKNPMATHAYMFKNSIARTMIKQLSCVQHPLDQHMIWSLLPVIKHYTMIPSIVRQRDNACFTDPEWIF